MKPKDWILFFRVPNLFIIALTMILLHFKVFASNENQLNILSLSELLVLIACTVLVAIGGNLINDFYDKELDLHNKPHKTYVGQVISPKTTLTFYWAVNILALGLAYTLGTGLNLPFFPLIILSIILLLWIYSAFLKKRILLGNILVAALSAAVVLTLFYVEISTHKNAAAEKISFAYSGFAFWTSLIREIVKDKQDEKGDMAHGARTLATLIPEPALSRILLFALLPIVPLAILFYSQYMLGIKLILATLFLLVPYAKLLLLFKSREGLDWKVISDSMKLLMLGGLFSLLFL